MNCKNIIFPSLELVGEQYKFFDENYNDPVRNGRLNNKELSSLHKTKQSIFIIYEIDLKNIYIDDADTLCYIKPFCKHCNSTDLNRKDFNTRKVFLPNGELKELKFKRYGCKKCGRKSQTELVGLYEPYAKIPTPVKELPGKALHNGHKTLRQEAADIKLYKNIPISHETVRKSLKIKGEAYYKNDDLDVSGYCSYDAQYIPIDGKMYYRLILFDTMHNVPIAETIIDKENYTTIKEFIEKSIPYHKRHAIVTDSKIGYDTVFRDLGFDYHQHCTFHLLQNINDKINNEINTFESKLKKELKQSNKNLTKKEIKNIVKKESKKYRKELQPYCTIIGDIFKEKNYKGAVTVLESVRKEIDKFPEFLREYLLKNFFPVYRRYLIFLLEPVKGKLNSTNNQLENYIGKILDKKHKKKFKTVMGAFSYIIHRIEGWINNHYIENI